MKWLPEGDIAHYREAATQLMDLAEWQASQKILFDLSELPDMPVHEQLWTSATLMPRITQLPTERVVICMPGDRIYNQQVMESLLAVIPPRERRSACDVQFFNQPEAGMHWLTDSALRLPHLLTEWD